MAGILRTAQVRLGQVVPRATERVVAEPRDRHPTGVPVSPTDVVDDDVTWLGTGGAIDDAYGGKSSTTPFGARPIQCDDCIFDQTSSSSICWPVSSYTSR